MKIVGKITEKKEKMLKRAVDNLKKHGYHSTAFYVPIHRISCEKNGEHYSVPLSFVVDNFLDCMMETCKLVLKTKGK